MPDLPPPQPVKSPATQQFSYRAQTVEGVGLHGQMEAADPEQAGSVLSRLGLRVLEITPIGRAVGRGPIRNVDYLAFNQQLANMVAAGMPLETGLRLMARDLNHPRLRQAVGQVANDLSRGVSLSAALEARKQSFPPLYSQLVAAGQNMNNLSGVLLGLGRHMELLQRMRNALWRTLAYPLVLLVVVCAVVCVVSWVVLPQFRSIYNDFNTRLPALTELVLNMGYWLPWVMAAIGALAVLSPLLSRPLALARNQYAALDRFVLGIPVLGGALRHELLARWCDTLALAVRAGVDLPQAMRLAAQSCGSAALAEESMRILQRLEQGQSLVNDSDHFHILPLSALTAMHWGITQHDLPNSLDNLSHIHQQQAEVRLSLLPVAFSPILIFGLGLLVGTIVLALFLPLVNLIQAVA